MGRDSRDSTSVLAVSMGRSSCTGQERSRSMNNSIDAALCRISDRALVALLRAMREAEHESKRTDGAVRGN